MVDSSIREVSSQEEKDLEECRVQDGVECPIQGEAELPKGLPSREMVVCPLDGGSNRELVVECPREVVLPKRER